MPAPKRMSDILASSSIDTRLHESSPKPTAPHSSEGPTLPIIGATNEHSTNGNSKKRKRSTIAQDSTSHNGSSKQAHRTPSNHPCLYTPWILLPEKQRKAIEARDTQNVVPIVYTKNQNVKGGINKIKPFLCAHYPLTTSQDKKSKDAWLDTYVPDALRSEDGIIAVSGQGDGTVKLVGIVDMVRRIAGTRAQRPDDEQEEGVKWYVYNVLSSVSVTTARKESSADSSRVTAEHPSTEGEAMDIDGNGDEDGAAVQETQRGGEKKEETKGKERRVPVLTVWMTRKKIPTFRDAFGEQEFVVYRSAM